MAGSNDPLSSAARTAGRGTIILWSIDGILLVILILIVIFAFAAATSLTKFGLINPQVTAARAPGTGTNGPGGRFDQTNQSKPCQDLYAKVAKYGVSMEYFYRAADKWGMPVNLLIAQAEQESQFNPNAYNPTGATGIIQILPGTWKGLYDKADGLPNDQKNAEASLFYGAKYMSQNYAMFHDWDLALAAYNAGPGNVQKYHGIPPFHETQDYVKQIDAHAQTYQDCLDKTNSTSPAGNGNGSGLFLQDVQRPNIGTNFTNFRNLDLNNKNLSIVLHNTVTAPGSGVPGNFKGANPDDISHFVVDGTNKYQLLPLDKVSRATYGLNSSSLSIEMVYMNPNQKQGAVLDTTADVVAELMARNNIPLSRIYAHSEVANGKTADGRPIPTSQTYPGERTDPGKSNMDYIKAKLKSRQDLRDLGLIDM